MALRRKSETYWVWQRKQLRSLVSQRRLEIIDRLVAAGPLAAKELARLVGAQPSALYHHLRQLMDVGWSSRRDTASCDDDAKFST